MPVQGSKEPFSGAVAAAERLRKPRSGERPAGLRTTRAELYEAKTAPGVRQGLVGRRKQTAKCGVPPVKFGGDSGAVRQVSDIGSGFERDSFTVRSRPCHGIRVKREIIVGPAPLRNKGAGESFLRARRFLELLWRTSLRRMRVCRTCVELASPAGMDRRRRESRLIRPPTDIGMHRSPAASGFSSRERALGRAGVPSRVFQKKENTGEGGGLRRHETMYLAVGPQVDFVRRRWHERAARLYLRHER